MDKEDIIKKISAIEADIRDIKHVALSDCMTANDLAEKTGLVKARILQLVAKMADENLAIKYEGKWRFTDGSMEFIRNRKRNGRPKKWRTR